MHESYKLCDSSAMFHILWKKHHCKNNGRTKNLNLNTKRHNKKQSKRDKRVLGKIKKHLFGKKAQQQQ